LAGTSRHDAQALPRPAVLDRVAGVFAQAYLQLAADWLRVAGEIAIEGADAGGLLVDNVVDVGVVLIGGNSEETKQEPEKHEEARQRKADHFIGARFPMYPRMNCRARKKNAAPGQRDKHCAKGDRDGQTRIIIDPIHRARALLGLIACASGAVQSSSMILR
jgi:hypothetical protein